jgi:hypothetical protein
MNRTLPPDLDARLAGLGEALAASSPDIQFAYRFGSAATGPLLDTAPVSLAGRVLGSRRVIVERHPHARHAYESATLRQFHDFRIREHRILSQRGAHG